LKNGVMAWGEACYIGVALRSEPGGDEMSLSARVGLFALSVLVLGSAVRLRAVALSPCVADDATLCLDDRPGDHRYQVRITYQTAEGGGLAGNGHAVPLAAAGFA